ILAASIVTRIDAVSPFPVSAANRLAAMASRTVNVTAGRKRMAILLKNKATLKLISDADSLHRKTSVSMKPIVELGTGVRRAVTFGGDFDCFLCPLDPESCVI